MASAGAAPAELDDTPDVAPDVAAKLTAPLPGPVGFVLEAWDVLIPPPPKPLIRRMKRRGDENDNA